MTPELRRDGVLLSLGLLALLAWDASGADLALARRYGTAAGFPWRDHWFTSVLLHDGARVAAWTTLAAVLANPGLAPRRRLWWLATALACAAAVLLLKRLSATSCPWSLAEFGGAAQYVAHWRWGVPDGGSGHCFPSGHASSAFALLAGGYVLRGRSARRWVVCVVAAGLLLGWAQMARGAHFASHTLWTAWICWALTAASHHAASVRRQRAGMPA